MQNESVTTKELYKEVREVKNRVIYLSCLMQKKIDTVLLLMVILKVLRFHAIFGR